MDKRNFLIPTEEMQQILYAVFSKYGFPHKKAEILAQIHTESTVDGVNSHGIGRVSRFIEYVKKDVVKVDAEAEKVETFGSIERWDGNLGPGIINALKCTDRAVHLAKENGMGMVALRNTNHWMRGGTYGWRAVDQGCISICFTNTQPNMPPWGGKHSRLGNNPFIVSIPRKEGHIVLDMAMSQFAFGTINNYKLKGEQLPFPGGWDDGDELTKDPVEILGNGRGLPIGYWKGSALSMVLDMLATLLSAGKSTYQVGKEAYEAGLSQVFLCLHPEMFGDSELQERLLREIIDYAHDVEPMQPGKRTYYPGERTLLTRKQNLEKGIPVNKEVWNEVLELAK